MAFQFDTATRNAWATQIATDLAGGTLKVWSGTEPANCATSDPATGLLCTIVLPSPALTASAGVTTISGTWNANASASGTASFCRGYSSGGTCVIQGNVTTDFVINNTSITSGQPVTVTQFTLTMPGA